MTSEAPGQNNKNDNITRISRRDFLKLLGALTFGGIIASLSRHVSALQTITPSIPLNSGLIAQPISPNGILGKWDIYSSVKDATPGQAEKCPVLPIHAALLRTGKVLFLSGSQNDPTFFSCKKFRNVIWDPTKPAGPSSFKIFDTPPGEPHTLRTIIFVRWSAYHMWWY
jgi:hypothetical protein